ncbi:peptidase C39 family protein [Streptomyces chumphonensis]|uniref:Peptidase C39 family protein n=1 Tax=Streptomyces chumphonensis TaxID=1214925 RepID=A0A927EYI3_9ACTN|nr:peptidase C39 family protein [Streptomyces chumphonensis]MBD3931730.1 peptidase C39 family protein [Streptomyces chumphonensis]
MSRPVPTRRALLAASVAVAATAAASTVPAAAVPARPPAGGGGRTASTVAHRAWSGVRDWRHGTSDGLRVHRGARPGLRIGTPAGTSTYRDPHGGTARERWEYGTWLSPVQRPHHPAGELIASWNADTPEGTWLRVEARGTYPDGTSSPWYTLGVWTSGDGDDVPRRTSVSGQGDGRSTVWTDTLAVTEEGLKLTAFQLRATLLRAPGSRETPTLWRLGAMTSDVPDRFEVPATAPGEAAGVELDAPRYSQNIHIGRYPEYDNGGEAWCSPTSSQMIIESWGRVPDPADYTWVDPAYDDPQVCHAARGTYDYQYEGCGNWPFNAAYAATYDDLQAVVTRLDSLLDAERLVRAGIPLITSQSFREEELPGAGYGTAGHLMTVVGFTRDGDVIANDPNADGNAEVRRVYPRRAFENIWLRTKRLDADGRVRGGTGGVCYLYFPTRLTPRQRHVLRSLGVA